MESGIDAGKSRSEERVLKVLGVPVKVFIFQTDDDFRNHRVQFETSHHMQTPGQPHPYITGSPLADSAEQAMDRVEEAFEREIRDAQARPDASWLKPNPDYRKPRK